MPFITLGIPNHDTLSGVSTADHHTATVAGDLALADLSEKLHASLVSVGVNNHHNRDHASTHTMTSGDGLNTAGHFALVTLFS